MRGRKAPFVMRRAIGYNARNTSITASQAMNIFTLLETVTPPLTIEIVDLSGAPTGETLTLKNPSSGEMSRAFSLYVRELSRIERDNKALRDAGEASGDYSEYNAVAGTLITKLDLAFAVSAVGGWSMDDELTDAAVEGLLTALPYLVSIIVSAEWAAKTAHTKK